ncbi:ABC transporter permease [Phycicoccus endophyticus]|nr:ABC transporter permease [Phycicoccus endophyticus]
MWTPGQARGLLAIGAHRYLLALLVRKELRVRYQASVLGLAWSYVKPGVQFLVFYFVMGSFLGLSRAISPFAVYLFSGMIAINLATEILGNATRSIVYNAPLVNKIFLPRQLFPVSSVFVALVHFAPQVVILVLGALASGWLPDLVGLAAFVVGVVIVLALSLGLGLLFAAVNVAYRDIENVVDLVLMVAVWFSPVLYAWTFVRDALVHHPWLVQLYLANPLTAAVELFHRAFWWGAATETDRVSGVVDHLWAHAGLALALSALALVVGDRVFRRLSRTFAQEL